MVDREYLDDSGPRSTRHRRWSLVVVPVVVALAALGVVRGVQLRTDAALDVERPSTPPQIASTASTSQSAPAVPPRGTLVVGTGDGVEAVDLGSGTSRATSVSFDARRSSMAAVLDGVVVTTGGPDKTQILVSGGFALFPTPKALTSVNTVVSGTKSSVWAAQVSDRQKQSTWRLTDLQGQVKAEVRASASVISDGDGGLLEVGRGTVRQVYPLPVGPRLEGSVLAAGPDGHVLRPCADADCADPLNLYTRSTNAYTKLEFAFPADVTTGVLSSYNRFVALTGRDGDGFRVEVRSMADGHLLRSFPRASSSTAVWLNQRWVAFASEDEVVLYDAVGNQFVTPAPELSDIGPITWQPA